ncbi:retrovirus-related pol polyprotein from transposon TNT 1-94 [Tanacetum coccineum]
MGTTRVIAAEGTKGPLNLGPERPRVYSDLSQEEKDRNNVNSKFVNNMCSEWVDLYTVLELNKGLKDSNFEQLYAYLKQHEAHANENKMMMERLTQQTVDPLALMSNVSPQHYHPQSSIKPPTTSHQATGRQNIGQGNNARGAGAVSYGRAQNRVGNANLGQARQVKCYNCNGVGHITRNCTQPKPGGQDNAFDEDVDEQPVQDLALNVDNVFQADDCDAYDSDVDEAPIA